MKVRRVDALMKLLLLPRVTSLPCIVIPLTQTIIDQCNYTRIDKFKQRRLTGASRRERQVPNPPGTRKFRTV